VWGGLLGLFRTQFVFCATNYLTSHRVADSESREGKETAYMAFTIIEAFKAFRARLEITDLQVQTVSSRHQNVRNAVAAELTVLDDFLTGSYCRSTLIAPLAQADIDIFMVLDPKYYETNGQAALLDRVRRALKRHYELSDVSRDGQAVTITFRDFQVDVVPGFYRKGGGYLIPNTRGGTWIATNPKEHERISGLQNKVHNGDLVPLEKMIKRWNREISGYFRSFHLEVLAWDILEGMTISNFSSGARYFFDKGRSKIAQQNPDPAGYGGDVGYYISGQAMIAEAVSRFTTAYNRALKAEAFEAQGNTADAIGEWRKIFGDSFPVYG
jgi:hypothetical protein